MLKSWSIKNFKPIVDSGELQLAPVTVLAGRNSSGKSSLLQSILMIAQTLGSRLLDRPLITNGSYIQLGTFDAIVNEFSRLKSVDVGISLAPEENLPPDSKTHFISSIKTYVRFSGENEKFNPKAAVESSSILVDLLKMEVFFEFPETLFDDVHTHGPEDDALHFSTVKMTDDEASKFLENVVAEHIYLAHDASLNYSGELSWIIGKVSEGPFLVKLSHFLPSQFIRKFKVNERRKISLIKFINRLFTIDGVSSSLFLAKRTKAFDLETSLSETSKQEILKLCREKSISNCFTDNTIRELVDWYKSLRRISGGAKASIGRRLKEIISQQLIADLQDEEDTEDLEEITRNHAFSNLKQAVSQMTSFFTSDIRYLGPLRADPGTIQQQFAPTSELDNVGTKGEYAAMVYHFNRTASIEWYNPQTQQLERSVLQKALDIWARYLNLADHIGTEEAGAIGITWQIVPQKGRKPRSLPELGVGISQILPILVMGLLSPTNSLLIIEQPELHLHPYVQARLGDFFMGLAKCKKQCLIETHSENLVSQLRLHIVEAGGLEKSDCMVYFVDQDEKGAAQFKQIEISPNGNIMNWPDGFFDETMLQEDRITAASLRKRAKKAQQA